MTQEIHAEETRPTVNQGDLDGDEESASIDETTALELRLTHLRDVCGKAAAAIPAKFLSAEPVLSQCKWFDYRYLDAVACTRRFAEAYVTVYREYWAELRDVTEAPSQQPIETTDLFANSPTMVTSLWKARMEADLLGARYEEYCRVAFRHLIGDRIWQRLPMPNQLYSEELIDHISDYLQESEDDIVRSRRTKDPRFKAENFRGDDPQQALVRELFQRVWKKDAAGRASYLSQLIHKREVSEHLAREEFGDELVDEQSTWRDTEPKEFTEGTLEAYRPSCFGLPHAAASDPVFCSACAFVSGCSDLATEITGKVVAVHGSADPKEARKREQAAHRKRQERERKRAAAAGSPMPAPDDLAGEKIVNDSDPSV